MRCLQRRDTAGNIAPYLLTGSGDPDMGSRRTSTICTGVRICSQRQLVTVTITIGAASTLDTTPIGSDIHILNLKQTIHCITHSMNLIIYSHIHKLLTCTVTILGQ